MGKHEAAAPAKKSSTSAPKHADPGYSKSKLSLDLPELKLPKLPKLSEISLPKFSKLFSSAPEEDEFDDDDEELDETAEPAAKAAPAVDEPTIVFKPIAAEEDEAESEQPEEAAAEDEQPAANECETAPELEEAAEEEASDELPGKESKFSLPKVDWTAVRGFFEKFASFGLADSSASQKYKRSYAFDRNQVLMTAGAALLFFLLWLLPTREWIRFVLYLVPFCFLGVYTIQDAVGEVLDRVIPGRSLMISVAAVGMLFLGQPRTAVFIMLIHRIFLLIEAYLYERKARELEKLDELIPTVAIAETEEGLEKKDPHEFAPGDELFVPAGDLIALDGVVIDGISTLDTSALCGANASIDVGLNSRVFAGCRNVTNPLHIRVTESFDESTVNRCVSRVKEAVKSEPSRADLLQRILGWLPLGLCALGVILGIIVSLITGSWRVWLYRGLLLIALGGCGDLLQSARLAYFTGYLNTFKEGISFMNADIVDRFAGSDMMIFSKTGTVTEGRYSVVAVYPIDYEEKDLLTIAALAECQSTHPIAVALREACGIDVHHRSDITLLEETPGRGIHTLFGGRNVYVGNSTLLMDHNIVFDVPSHKGTVIHVAVDNKYAGCIVLNDHVREGAFDTLEELRLRGIRATVMLTGDVRSMARPIASSLSFDMVKCELSNEAKLEALNYLRESKGNSAAIDYVSCKDEDVELLQAADVGIGFNALSQPGLLRSASVLIMGSKIFQIPQALFLAKRISIAALLDTAIMLGLMLLLIVLCLCGFVSAWAALLLLLIARVGTLVYTLFFK